MKARFRICVLASFFMFVFMFVACARADWNSIGSGYTVTSNWHGINVPLGQSVVATAGTTDSTIVSIEFKWNAPNGTTIYDVTVTPLTMHTAPATPPNVPQEVINWADNNNGTEYYYAQDTRTPSIPGDWGVQALFYNAARARISTKATSFNIVGPGNVVPQVPLLGTAGAAIAMALGLGAYLTKRRKAC